MDTGIIKSLVEEFDSYAQHEDNVEFWFARDLQKLLGYVLWQKFKIVIGKAKEACKQSKNQVVDHFIQVDKMVQIGSGAKRNIENKDLHGEYPITREHVENNASIRQVLLDRGIKPEDLPRAEDVRKVERRLKAESKKITKSTGKK